MVSRPGVRATVLLSLAVGALGVSADGSAQRRFWDRELRVLVSDGGLLSAVAVGSRHVYAASPGGVLVRDFTRDAWEPPIPWPLELIAARPSALACDPGGAIWLGTDAGDVFTIVPGFDRWDRVPGGAGRIEALIARPSDGAIWARSSRGWSRIQTGSLMAVPVAAGDVPRDVLAAARPGEGDAFFEAARGHLGLDAELRRWRLIDAARGAEPGEHWVATEGGGLLRFDGRTGRREWLRWGLAGTGAGSISVVAGRLWFGGDGRGPRNGVASADPGLEEFRQFDAIGGAPRGFIAEMIGVGPVLWMAAADGLFRLDPTREAGDRRAWTRITTRDGLASDRVRSVLAAHGLIWAGTDRGLNVVTQAGEVGAATLFTGRRVSRLALHGDALLAATDAGLWQVEPGPADPQATGTPVAFSRNPALRGRVTDVLVAETGVWAVADGDLYRADGAVSQVVRDAALDRIGPILRLAEERGRLWAAGPRGVASRDPGNDAWEAFTVPDDIPAGPVVDVRPVGDDVWVATPAGAVRLRWR